VIGDEDDAFVPSADELAGVRLLGPTMSLSKRSGGTTNGNADVNVDGFGSFALPKPCSHALPHALLLGTGSVNDSTSVANGAAD
jgi:hypothetical protein